MHRSLMAALVAVLFVAPAAAEQQVDAGCGGAPCGYINPIIDLVFPEKLDCGTGNVLGAEPTPADCMTPPQPGQPLVMEGTLRWYWDASYDGTYPSDPSQDIEVSFGKTSTHPGWIDFSVEPATFVITNADLFHPENFREEVRQDGSLSLYYWWEQPITVTFTRTAEPTPEEIEAMQNKDGVQPVFVKVKSTASGSQYKEAYGIELFRFHGANDPVLAPLVEKEAPSPAVFAILLAVLGAALIRRRQ